MLLVVCPALWHTSIVACVNNFGVNNTDSIMAEGENPAGIFKGKDRLCCVKLDASVSRNVLATQTSELTIPEC
jgi:hypothetical protein